MSVIKFATAVKNTVLNDVKAAIDSGSGAGTIKVYTGTMASTPETAVGAQVLLGTLTFSDPCGSVTTGTLTMEAITQDFAADATGVATWARIADSAGVTVFDVDITNTGGGGTMQLNTTNIVVGGPILCTAFTMTVA